MAKPGTDPIVFSHEVDSSLISRRLKTGVLQRLASGLYSTDVTSSAEQIIQRNAWRIISGYFPDGVIVDRSAAEGADTKSGILFLDGGRKRRVTLPGLVLESRQGPGSQANDMPFPYGLHMSSTERALLDNLAVSRVGKNRISRTLGQTAVEDWVERILQQRGEEALVRIRSHARSLSVSLEREAEMKKLDEIIGAAIGSRIIATSSKSLQARQKGIPYDSDRVEKFSLLANDLSRQAPRVLTTRPSEQTRRTTLPFFEAYFSNFIEGTEFEVDEAIHIITDHFIPKSRPQDAHDILETFEIVSDQAEMSTIPSSAKDLNVLLQQRHSRLMHARPDKTPGAFKAVANRAGSSVFVAPELVEGTLAAGFDIASQLLSPFSRAVYMMFLISEVHPFVDGNGRIARIMMNAELVARGEHRIIIPTVYRNNYLASLRALTTGSHTAALISVLDFAHRYTARIDFTSFESAREELQRTNAFEDPTIAEGNGLRLTLP